MNIAAAKFEGAAGLASQLFPGNLPEVAFSGRSIVGKSSLINKLLNRKSLARTSATPGKTITVNFYRVGDARLVDLPGYGYAKVSFSERMRWSELVEGYFNDDRDLRLVLQLIDMRHPPSEEDINMLHYLLEREIPFQVILTKSDKLNATQRKARLEALQEELDFLQGTGVEMIPFSAMKGENTQKILEIVSAATEKQK